MARRIGRTTQGRTATGLSLGAALLLFACGGDGETDAPPSGDEAPASQATASGPTDGPSCGLEGPVEELLERASPPDSASVSLDGGVAKICYGAPSVRDREIFGGLVPYGEPWRIGANEATALHVTAPIEIGDLRLDPGSYSLYAVPGPDEWEIVANSAAQRWGVPIDEGVQANDLGSLTVTPGSTSEHVEVMRIDLASRGGGEAAIVIEWADTRVEVPFRAAGA